MAAVTAQLRNCLEGGAVSRLAMPEKDELLITIRNNSTNYRLLISAGASLPLIYLSGENKPSPLKAPAFCMLLRKYLSGARILSVSQTGLERIITIDFEHKDDLGDLTVKHLIFEMMGKYSNIIFTNDKGVIIDSIKRVPSSVSSLREVLPGRQYVFPSELCKQQPLAETSGHFIKLAAESTEEIYKFIYKTYSGFSPVLAQEVCCRAGIDPDKRVEQLTDVEEEDLYEAFSGLIRSAEAGTFSSCIISRKGIPEEFAAFHLKSFEGNAYEEHLFDSVSEMLEEYYSSKDTYSRIRQKTSDLRKTVTNLIERCSRKYDIQLKQLKDCEGKDKFKVYGDLLNTYGYSLKGGEKSFSCENYYDENRMINIPLDPHKSASENAKRYYERYAKLRRTEEALNSEIVNTENDIEHLNGILQSLSTSMLESDISQIRAELTEFGYIRKRAADSGKMPKSQPVHLVSSDGFDIYIGKNNYQNEEVTFKIADGNDWWFHAKNCPGSHVIVKTGNSGEEIPDRVFTEAAGLAAFYSKKGNDSKVEVDYTQRKNLKRTPGGPPGYVIYHTNYSMNAEPISKI